MARSQEERFKPPQQGDGSMAKTIGGFPAAALAFVAAQCGGASGPLPGAAKKGRGTLEENKTSLTHRSHARARHERRGGEACAELAAVCGAQCHGAAEVRLV